ncbi:hypothetical protein HYALB_00011932 [Hymenoscyphus albidus]|uniref:MaoC-like domain-containing protein n=1 Tax=Hymenoscyphus albidus TaxID=595503 RepID=A0A9N9LMJ3_9HELO|nr:hypothetical protein HYALB_00011932 [Hymenoscyphus albidus]
MRKSIVGIYDKGSGTIVHSRHELIDESEGVCYAEVDAQSFYVGQGGWGGPRGPKGIKLDTPKRKPDFVVTEQTGKELSLLYRLNGDYNPLHATPEPGKDMDFPGVILHGLGTWNISAHAIVRTVGSGDGSTLQEFQARFASPVLPGDKLLIDIWNLGFIGGKEDLVDVRFSCRVDGGKVVLKEGQAILKVPIKGSEAKPKSKL